jgi:hypothetical protein
LHLLTRYIPGRTTRLSEYGVVFTREFIISAGAQPAIYINSYSKNDTVKEAADKLFELCEKRGMMIRSHGCCRS